MTDHIQRPIHAVTFMVESRGSRHVGTPSMCRARMPPSYGGFQPNITAPIPTAKIRREGPLDPLKGCGNYGGGAWSGTRVLGNKVTKNRVWSSALQL